MLFLSCVTFLQQVTINRFGETTPVHIVLANAWSHVAVHEQAKIQKAEIARLTAEVERLRKEGKHEEADAVAAAAAAERASSGRSTPKPTETETELNVAGTGTPDFLEMQEIDSLPAAVAKLMNEWLNDGMKDKLNRLEKKWKEVDEDVLVELATKESMHVARSRLRNPSWQRQADVKIKTDYRENNRTKRCVSSSPFRIRSDNARSRLFGRKRGRPRLFTPGYDGKKC